MSSYPVSDRAQRVLLLANKYPAPDTGSWLTSELAEEFSARGLDVTVLCFDSSCKAPTIEQRSGVTVHRLPGPGRSIRSLIRYPAALRAARKVSFGQSWSVVVGFSVGARFLGLLPALRRRQPSANSTFVLWDFFPDHHRQVGSFPDVRLLALIARRIEGRCYSSVDKIAVMSPRNRSFLNSVWAGDASIIEVPPWGPNDVIARQGAAHRGDRLEIVFGGQLEVGRGLEQLLRFAEAHQELAEHVRITIFGSGRLEQAIRSTQSDLIDFRGQVDRQSYLNYLSEFADVGLVITSPGVTVPSYPSKSIDYMRAGVPILAVVEASTDFGNIIADRIKCGVSVIAGDDASLRAAVDKLRDLHHAQQLDEVGANGQRYYQHSMTVSSAADSILAQPSGRG